MTAKEEGAGSSPLGQRATEVLVGAATQLGRMVGRVRTVGERAAEQIGLTDKPGESTTQAIDAPTGTEFTDTHACHTN